MQDLYARIAGAADTSEDVARQSVAHILAFMQAESDDPAVGRMVAETPGASEALAATDGADGSGGIMGLGARLMALGLDMGQIRAVAEELVSFSKAQLGEETVDDAIASVPALAQFV
ncbi:DUF2267 domain-containing protein [Aureimonas populi]|uniref:DUF2267 domain-containing protein n=1 Tax=Aureimonas populi TaxID=1701758 RepID=A0ABW5CJZ0_9HYPH|nr:DUF2267 domain-containing protein [Aureimonas populi]